CPCHLASRECDPELCIGCASRDHTLGRCMNSQIQHKNRKLVCGAFPAVSSPAPFRSYDLQEYVGELVYDETTRSRECFGIDAVHAGNEARFVNHREHDNVAAYIKLVNGEPRIGLYANRNIKPGAELFIDYGRDFFKHNEAKEDSELESLASFVGASYEDTQEWIPSQ
ncbi:SET domain-containing protein, partial [Schizophyllum commune Loenen D]